MLTTLGYALLVAGVLFNALGFIAGRGRSRDPRRRRSPVPPAVLRLGPVLLLAGFALLVFGDRD